MAGTPFLRFWFWESVRESRANFKFGALARVRDGLAYFLAVGKLEVVAVGVV